MKGGVAIVNRGTRRSSLFLLCAATTVTFTQALIPAHAEDGTAGRAHVTTVRYVQKMTDEEIAARLEAANGDRYALPAAEAFEFRESSAPDPSEVDLSQVQIDTSAGALDNLWVPSLSDVDAPTVRDVPPPSDAAATPYVADLPTAQEAVGTQAVAWPWQSCMFYTDGDNVHRTNGDATGHGWWMNINCPRGQKATITIWLQEKLSGEWYIVASGQKTSYPGSGSVNRANARTACINYKRHTWRSLIDVDLVNRPDSPEMAVTPAQSLYCY